MSIENNIVELTAAVKELTATILATTKLAPAASAASTGAGDTGTAATQTAAEKKAAKAAAEKAAADAAAAKAADKKGATITREMMVAALGELKEAEGGGLPECIKIIKGTGEVDKMKDIPEENIKAVYDAAKAKILSLASVAEDGEGM